MSFADLAKNSEEPAGQNQIDAYAVHCQMRRSGGLFKYMDDCLSI